MRDENIRIRAAAPEDAAQLLDIYTPYVEQTAITFEYDVPTLEEFRGRIARTLQKYPYLTAERSGELLGYVLSTMSLGLLASSLAYAVFAPRLSRRTWYVLSMFGMLLGVAILGALPPYPFMLLGALVLGVSAGPASALLGFFMLDRIPEASRGSALGTQNSLLLAAAPVAVFATSVGVSALGTSVAAVVLVGCWMAITAFALVARGMRNLDDAAPDLKREEGALEEARLDS